MTKEERRKRANKIANNLKDTLTGLIDEIERNDLHQDIVTLYYNIIKTNVEQQYMDNGNNIDTILEYARPLNNIIYLLHLIDRKREYINTLDKMTISTILGITKQLSKYCNWFNKQ